MSDILERYAVAERAGRARVPNRAIEAFGLDWWNKASYPYRIESLDELWRYHDSMHDGRYTRNLRLIGEVSSADVDLCTEAAQIIYDFSASRFAVASPARHALTRAFYQYRLLRDRLRTATSPWTILEVGPGSGYLGLLLGMSGHRYLAVEAAQAFFAYQSELWRFAFGTSYADGLKSPETAQVSHVPWWTFNEEGYSLPTLNAVTCNHALAEMNPGAVRRIFTIVNRTGQSGCFMLAESLGKRYRSAEEVVKIALESAFDVSEESSDLWMFRPSKAAEPTVTRRSASKASWSRPVRVFLGARVSRSLARVAVRFADRRRQLRSGALQPLTAASPLSAIFDRFPDTATPDLRYLRGDW